MKITITKEIDITDEALSDTLCAAFEGGSNYWCALKEYANPTKIKGSNLYLVLPLVEDNLHGVVLSDCEDPETTIPLLNRAALQKGLEVLRDKYPERLEEIWTENGDAETGDVFLQCCLFGEVVYG